MHRQIFEYHPIVGYRFIPRLNARIVHEGGGYLLKVNAQGFRSEHDFTLEKKPGKFRVLLFGDSYTAGEGVSNDKRYADLLEKTFPNVEIFNFALPGTGTDQQYLIFREFAKKIQADLIVIAVLVENVRRNPAHFRLWHDEASGKDLLYAKPYFELHGQRLDLRNTPVSKKAMDQKNLTAADKQFVDSGGRFAFLRNAVLRLGLGDVAQKVSGYQPVPEYDSSENPAWQLMQMILKRWIAECSLPVLLVPIPLYAHLEETAPAKNYLARFSELAKSIPKESKVTLCDILPTLQKYSLPERRAFRFKKDPHPSELGHAALAKAIAPFLKACLHG